MKHLSDDQLAAYLTSLLPSRSLEAAIDDRNAPGLEAVGDHGQADMGRRVIEKLAQRRPLDLAERFHLEAVILPDQRPALDIVQGDYHSSHPLWLDLNTAEIRGRLQPLFPAIGRVDVPGHPSMLHAGTGFVVGPDLLMTNRHVAELFVSGVGRTDLRFVPGIRPQVDLLRERDNPAEAILKVVRAEMVHPWWDMALLRVEGLQPDHPVLRLSTRETRDLAGRRLVVVGYPALSPYNPADVQQQVFGGVYGIKRLQPGLLGTEQMLAGLWGEIGSVRHDASTLGGNSGSCLIDVETAEVLGLHFAGTYAVANYAVPAGAMARDGRIVDAGVAFSGVPGVQTGPWDKAWVGIGAETPQPAAADLPATAPAGNTTTAWVSTGPDGTARIVLPLEISVRIGSVAPLATGAAAAVTGSAGRAAEPLRQSSDDDRPGHDAAFPGAPVPIPLRTADQATTARERSIRIGAGIADTPASDVAVPASGVGSLAPIAELLDFWRSEQNAPPAGTPAPGAVFVANLTGPVSDQTISADLTSRLGLAVEVGPLFSPDRELDRFRRITIAGVTPADRADLFDMARAMRDILGAETVDPDLSSGYGEADPTGPAPPVGSPESADFAFWCWVPDKAENLPADPDWAMTMTRTRAAWAMSVAANRPAKGAGIVIAQPDTGIVPTHSELPPGLINDPLAVNLVELGQPPVDPLDGGNEGHGTATGSVAASPEAGAMSGSAPAARLVPIRAIRSVTVFDQSRVAQAIDHARRGGAHVISLSLGGLFSSALHAALRRAVAENIIVVAAAGNCVGEVVWPARYDEAIAVAGVNAALKPWKGSCRGRAVDISGPAEFVRRADARDAANPGKVSGGQGTSFATAHLAGLAACWLAHHGRAALIAGLLPGGTLQALFRARLRAGAQVPAGFDTGRFGAGIVDAVTLLQAAPLRESAPEAAPRGIAALVRDLGLAAYGPEAVAQAAPAFDDPQSLMELASAALDLGRARNTRRAAVEAMPPAGLSDGLRALIGQAALRGIDGRVQR